MYHYYHLGPRVSPEPIKTIIAPNDPRITYSDLAGTWSIDAAKARPTRPILDGQGFENAAPGARASISVTCTKPTQILVAVEYTALITRLDTYNPVGTVLVDGLAATDFTCPVAGPQAPGSLNVMVSILAGVHEISVIWPYCAAMDVTGFGLPSSASLNAAPVRTSKKIIVFGDSRVHGFFASKTVSSWAWQSVMARDAQILNMGYGGRGIDPGDATIAAGFGASGAIYMCDYNSFYPISYPNETAIQNAFSTIFSNFRTVQPTAPFLQFSSLWSEADIPAGPYAGNVPTLQTYRDAELAGVTAYGDPNIQYLSGNTDGMPVGWPYSSDGVHPNDAGAAIIAPLVSAKLASMGL